MSKQIVVDKRKLINGSNQIRILEKMCFPNVEDHYDLTRIVIKYKCRDRFYHPFSLDV